jgi:hypothetical protein
MFKLTTLLGFGILGMALLVSTGASQDKDKKDPKAKGQLPPGWKQLNLSKEQTLQIYGIQAKFKSKIMALEKEIKDLRAEEKTKMVSVLTAEQKELLLKLAVGEEEPKDKKDKGKPKDDKDKDK